MTDPVPAPEQQGDDQLYEDAVESLREAEAGERPTPREELRMKPEEQQGEPVCARCGETFSPSAAYPGYHWRYIQIGERSENRLCGPFEPAPPSSEEAETRRSNKRPPPLPLELLFPGNLRGERRAYVEGWIEGRSPLEERVRDLRRWAEIDHANLEALEEERDRLRGLLQSIHAAGEVDGRNALIARAEAAEAQVAHGAALAAADGEVIDHLRAQVAELREALEQIAAMRGGDVVLLRDQMRRVAALALAAVTVQEGGGTDGR